MRLVLISGMTKTSSTVKMILVQAVLFLLLQGSAAYESNAPSGNSTSVPTVLAGELVGNITLSPSQGPFVIEKDLFVPEGSRLTLQPGVQLLFRPETGLEINGSLVAEGSPENKISFSSLPSPNASLNASFYYASGVRLVDGNNYNEGRLEIKVGNKWGVICSDYWIKENTEVACRYLGFLGAKRSYKPFVRNMPYVVDYFKCNGDESSLWSCKYSTYVYCPYAYPIGIECVGLQSFLKENVNWRGMSFMTQPQEPLSMLKHVTIEDAIFALKATYQAPKMSSVTIRNSFHGIQVDHLIRESDLEFTDVLVHDSILTGMRIMNSKSDMKIHNSSVTATTLGDGLSLEDKTGLIDFCTWSQNSTIVFPLMFSASSDGSDGYCSKEIRLNGSSSLSLHYRSIKGSSFTFEVSERDAQGNWKVISTANENDNGKLHTPSKATHGNGLKIEFRSKRGTNKIDFVIIDEKAARSLFLSNCTFLHNGKRGININNFTGHFKIVNSRLSQNTLDGAYIKGLAGKMEMIGLDVANNSQVGVALEKNSGLISLEKFNINYNEKDGIKAYQETGFLVMKNGVVKGNEGRGIYVGYLRDLQLNLESLEISINKERGLYFEKTSNGSVNIINVKTALNSKHGAHFTQCSTPVVIHSSFVDKNGGHGFYFQAQGGFVRFLQSSASRNQESGFRVDNGVSLLFLEDSILKGNKKHGFYLNNHGKEILMVNVSITNNNEKAISVYENSRGNRITLLSLTDCYISGNKVGVNLMFSCAFKSNSVRFVNLKLRRNTFANNTLETFGFYHEHTCYHTTTPRQVFLNMVNNTFIQNKKSVIHISCPGIYALQGNLTSNVFLENLGKVVTIKEGTNCGNRHKYAISIIITSNRFENNTGQYMVSIDLQPWHTIRSAVLRHNSFVMNKETKLPSRFYSRMTEDAVVVLKEGTFRILQNSFENPNFTYQVAAALAAFGRVIDATHNWWGTKKECKIQDMIFDKEDRLDFVKAEYYPFLLSKHSSDVISPNISRPLCFLKESYLGGTLDRHLVLSNKSVPYRVVNDLLVLPKGSLVIESNVTLIFPPRSAFVVQGSLNVYGEEGGAVKFTLDKALDSRIRLKDGWHGNVEIKYNNTWMTLCVEWRYVNINPNMICNHFNMEYESRSLYRRSGKEAGFINNLKCDHSLALDMTYCNYKNLTYAPRCNDYVLYLRCKRPYWSGVHLAMTKSQSNLLYLDVHEGGHNYRSTDLKITAAALRVDFDNHVMRNIKVKHSASVGVHVLYSNPFKNVPTLSHSLVDDSESNGLQISFSSTTLDNVNILNTKERGIYVKSFWNDVDIDAQRMSDPEFVERISNCKTRSIFIKEGHTKYFIFSPIEGVVSATCDHEVHTTNGSNVGVQMVYKNLKITHWSFNEIEVYSGKKQWAISKLLWEDRPVLYANSSSIRLRFIKYSRYSRILVHLLVFTVNGTNTKVSQHGQLSITNSTIKKTSESAIIIDGNQLDSIKLQYSTVQDGVKNGLAVTLFRVNLLIQSSVIERHSQCIYLSYPNYGIHGNALVSNSKISRCSKNGIYVGSYGKKNITIHDSLLLSNQGVGVHVDGRTSDTSLYIKGCRFYWNRQHCINAYSNRDSGSSTEFHVLRSSFFNNGWRVINIRRATSLTKWLIEGNVFFNNSEPSVFSIGVDFSSASYTVRNNSFISNRCTKDAVIDLCYNARFVDISQNTFVRNVGPSVIVKTAVKSLPLTIVSNTFKHNVCPGCPILRFLRTEKGTVIVENNTMVNNTGQSMILIQAVHDINSRTTTQTLALVNNTITNNRPSSPSSRVKTCIVEANGIPIYKHFQWERNKISNLQYDYEFCLRLFALSQVPFLSANKTWWGVNTENDIPRRVLSFDINYEFGIVEYGSFLALENNVLKTKEYDADSAFNELLGKSILRGRIHKSITLERQKSPFKVLGDVTVLPNTVLTIEPGVTVQLAPYTSMLVLGTLIAKGEQENHITFKHIENSKNSETLPDDIRLMDGKFPWHGRFEVYHDSSWKPMCTESWKRQNTIVACRQLGYDGPSDADMRPERFCNTGKNRTYPFDLQCSGDESTIAECSKNSTGQNVGSCQSFVGLRCRGKEWGSIRFSRPAIEKANISNSTSVLEYVDIMYAGKRESSNTSAIEMIRRVPIIKHLKVLNCSSGGINIVFPDKNHSIEASQFMNTGGTGITVKENTKSIVIKDCSITDNNNGVVFSRWDDELVSSFAGQDGVLLCDNEIHTIYVKEHEFLYFATMPVKGYTNDYPTVNCQKRLRTEKGMGIVLRVLSVKGSQTLRVHAGNTDVINTEAYRWKGYTLYIDFDDVQVSWQGAFSSQILLLATPMKLKDMPCTLIRNHMCGWQSVPNKKVLGMTTNGLLQKRYWRTAGHLISYRALYWWLVHYLNLVSPLIIPDANVCRRLNFEYSFIKHRYIWLSVLLEEYENGTETQTQLWSSDEEETVDYNFTQAIIQLPLRTKPFRIVLFVKFKKGQWDYRYVYIKNLKFRDCSTVSEIIDINGNVFTKNRKHSILLSSNSIIQRLKIHRNKFTDVVDDVSTGAIKINTYDNPFYISNNFVSNNNNGGMYATVGSSHGNFVIRSTIERNYFQGNKKETIFLDTGSSGKAFIDIFGNTLTGNNGTGSTGMHSTIKLSQIVCTLEENFVYDNHGKYVLEITLNKRIMANRLIIVRNNTFYHNHGLIKDHGSTMYCSGPVKVYKNVIKNPSNLYELVTDRASISRTMNATDNWWGYGSSKVVGTRIVDATDDYRLPKVNYFPYVRLRPPTAVPLSCPAVGWILFEESCFLYHGGPLPYYEADNYCLKYGSHLLGYSNELDMSFIKSIFHRYENQTFGLAPRVWITGSKEVSGCSAYGQDGNFSITSCESLQPFVCSKSPLIRCPNNCFHNGKCVGTTCFCNKGWTGSDCSKFHCNNLRNCSGHGTCVGPNVCRCLPGISGRACTYSYCTQFENCRSCISSKNCGWCDNLGQCLPGHGGGSYFGACRDWFFYNCYTMGRDSFCSRREIMLLDCNRQLCNFQGWPELASKEACQRCKDQEKCFQAKDAEGCRTWNETRCPNGQVKIDYSDATRVHNTQMNVNTRIISPDKAMMYRCESNEPDGNITTIFVFSANLTLKPGNVISSNQAGGVFHKVLNIKTFEPYTFVTSDPASVGDFIQYADFQIDTTLESLNDEVTVEAEPNMDVINNLLQVNASLNETFHVIPQGTFVYKCVGHMYEKADETKAASYYLVFNASNTPFKIDIGDVIVSNQSHGYLSTITNISKTSDFIFVETLLLRCSNTMEMSFKFPSRQPSDKDISCPGGDNNPNLLIRETNNKTFNWSVNDVIADRPSQPVVAKVKSFHYSQGYLVVEVLPVTSIVNETAVTEIEISEPLRHVRRKRAVYNKRFGTSGTWGYGYPEQGRKVFNAITGFSVSFSLTLQLEVSRPSISKLPKVRMNIYMYAEASAGVGVSFELREGDSVSSSKRVVNGLALKRFSLCFYVLCVPAGIFFDLDASGTINAESRVGASASYSIGISKEVGNGECSTTGRCQSSLSEPSIRKRGYFAANVDGKLSFSFTFTPRLRLQIPAMPRILTRIKWFSRVLNKISKEVKKRLPIKLPTINVNLEIPLIVQGNLERCSSECQPRNGLKVKIGAKKVDFSISIGQEKDVFSKSSGCLLLVIIDYCYGPPDEDCKPSKNPFARDLGCGNDTKSENGTGKCGDPPVCLTGWSGEACSKPDPPSGCVNGQAFGSDNCTVTCKCDPGWIGEACDVRAPSITAGDPHLTTFDGVNYDYFGIGEFCGCQSIENDFGLQFRFFAYERSSLTGGIALKAGNNTITVMTVRTLNSTDLPILRLNGQKLDVVSLLGEEVKLDNGTVLMDLHRKTKQQENGSAVLLMSVEYKSGAAVSFDVRHSKVMGRQYINIGLTPTIQFKRKTSGLYGYMDGDPSNDFQGPDGKIYSDPIQFADSWRITTSSSRSSAGWSWKHSNFHPEDVMDHSYIDPNFVPLYNLEGISQQAKEKAVSVCASMGLSGDLLKGCVYDIAITNDTSLSEQETLQQGCENVCSGRGRCINSTCECIEGWSGKTCEIGQCSNCSVLHGKCVTGFCHCNTGWEGEHCDQEATCFNQNNCTSPLHGKCKTTDVCLCNDGFTGKNCSIIPTCYEVANCSSHGVCVDFDVCKCHKDWTGQNCSDFSCHDLSFCSGHGRCTGLYECKCDRGWRGVSCGIPDCPDVNQCSQNGDCISSNKCKCKPGFQGENCSSPTDCSSLSNCTNHGICENTDGENSTCRCFSGFSGPACNETSCEQISNCTNHGECIDANLCNCSIGYTGYDCSNFSCEILNFCSGRGECIDYDVCKCSSLWHGVACTIPNCTAYKDCSQKGDCIAPNTCECYRGYDGKYCDQLAPPNLHHPVFNASDYNFTLSENSPAGTLIGMVVANDSDSGRNGKISFSLVSSPHSRLFLLNSFSGALSTGIVFDYETIHDPTFEIEVIASDDGFPQKFTKTNVLMTIRDINDNCPVFDGYPASIEKTILHTNVSILELFSVVATDADSGENGYVTYGITPPTIQRYFAIDPYNGTITVVGVLQPDVYIFDVVATDYGNPPCESKKAVKLTVYSFEDKTHTTEKPSSTTTTSTKPTTTEMTTQETEKPKTTDKRISSTLVIPSFSKTTTAATTTSQPQATKKPLFSDTVKVVGFSILGVVILAVVLVILVWRCCRRKVTPRNQEGRQNKGCDDLPMRSLSVKT